MRAIDVTAIGLSAVCVVHCLALPAAALALPAATAFMGDDWIAHLALFVMAAPLTGTAFWLARRHGRLDRVILALGLGGLSLMAVGAAPTLVHDLARAATLFGVTLVAGAHLLLLRRRLRAA